MPADRHEVRGLCGAMHVPHACQEHQPRVSDDPAQAMLPGLRPNAYLSVCCGLLSVSGISENHSINYELCQNSEAKVDQLWYVLAQRTQLWHEMCLDGARILDEILQTLGKFSGTLMSMLLSWK